MAFGSLIIRHSDGRYETRLLDKATFDIGSAADNDLVLDDPAVAPHHLQLVSDGRGSAVLDLGSAAGTLLGGQRLDQSQQRLESGAILKLGGARIVVNLDPPATDSTLSDLLGAPLGGAPPAAAQPPVPRRPAAAGAADIQLRLSAEALQVEAGKSMSVRVTVRNRASFVDQVDLAVEGVPASWVTVKPDSHALYPDASASAEVVFQPPRAPQSEAKTYPINVVATSREDPEARSTVQLTLAILPFSSYSTAVDPQRRTATVEGGFELRVTNSGNRLEQYRIVADDDEDSLTFRITPASLRIPPGETRAARVRARSRRIKLVGQPVPYAFTTAVEPVAGGIEPQAVRATFAQQPPFSTWLIAGLVGLLLLACLGLAGYLAVPRVNAYLEQQRAYAAATAAAVEAKTAVAEQRTADTQLTQVVIQRDATLTAVAERQLLRETAARDDAERTAIAGTAQAEVRNANGTAAAVQNVAATAQAAAQGTQQAAQQAQFNQERTIIALRNARPTGTPIYSATQTALAVAPVLEERLRNATAISLVTEQAVQHERETASAVAAAAPQTQEAFFQTQTAAAEQTAAAIAANQQVFTFGATDTSPSRAVRSGYEWQSDGMVFCFFSSAPFPYPPPPTAAPAAPPPAPAVPELPNPVVPSDTLTTSGQIDLSLAAATPTAGELYAIPLPQASTTCLPQLAQPQTPLDFLFSPQMDTRGATAAIYGSYKNSTKPVLTADSGVENQIVSRAVGVLIFPTPAARVDVELWHPFDVVAGYRMYALDNTGQIIAQTQTDNLAFGGPQPLTIDVRNSGRRISGVVLMGLDTGLPADLRGDILAASQPIYIQSITMYKQ